MNKEVFKEQMGILLIAYPNWRIKETDPAAMKIWYELLIENGLNDDNFPKVVKAYITNECSPPTIASLIDCKKKNGLYVKEKPKLNFVYRDL